jgi:hypothetical protein
MRCTGRPVDVPAAVLVRAWTRRRGQVRQNARVGVTSVEELGELGRQRHRARVGDVEVPNRWRPITQLRQTSCPPVASTSPNR